MVSMETAFGTIPVSQTENRPSIREIGLEAGKARFENWTQRVEKIKEFAYTALGTGEMAGEVAKRGWEVTVGKVNEVKTSVREKVDSVKESARLMREKAVNAFIEKTRPIREFAAQKRDQIVDKAKAIGTGAAMTVALGAGAVVATVEFGMGAAESGANAVDSAVRWTLAEVQSKPLELRSKINEGLAGVVNEAGKAMLRYGKERKAIARTERARVATIRTHWGVAA